MTERVLTTRELNRALLARQLLLERSRMPLVRAVERVGGLQTQYAPSAYIGLWTRLERFDLDQLTRALDQARHPGDAHALDHPRRLRAGLLAVLGRTRPFA